MIDFMVKYLISDFYSLLILWAIAIIKYLKFSKFHYQLLDQYKS